jgi:hypothetical protein
LIEDLLTWAKQYNPRRYENHKPYHNPPHPTTTTSEKISKTVEFSKNILELMPNEFSEDNFHETLRRLVDDPKDPNVGKLNIQLLHILHINNLIERIGGPENNSRYRKVTRDIS